MPRSSLFSALPSHGDAPRDVVDLFHYALRGEGCLVLGGSESVETQELFRVRIPGCPSSRSPGHARRPGSGAPLRWSRRRTANCTNT